MRDVERELRDLGRLIDFPDTPDLAGALRSRTPARSPFARRRWLVLVAAALAVAALAGLTVPQARTAILRALGLGAVRVEYVDRLPVVEPGAPVAPGARVDPADAPLPILRSTLLGEPDGVYASGSVVTLVWGSRERVRVLVTEIGDSSLAPDVAKKVVAATTAARLVPIPGSVEPGLWIEGDPHVVVLPGIPPRLAANTLVWTAGDLTLRLEGALSAEQAVRIAESFG